MQRFVFRKVLSETNFLRLQKRCCTLSPPPPPPPDYYKAPTPVPVMPSFDYTPPKYTGKSAEEILANRKKFLFPTLAPMYNKPLTLVAGKNQYVFDENGKRYLDAFAGAAVASCGHCHDDVVNSVVKQMKLLQHTSLLYLNEVITDYAEALVSKMPENSNLKVVYFTNSGTEANELALLLATLKTQCNDIISLRKGYYGLSPATMGANGLSKNKFNRVQTGIQHALNPDPYRGDFGSDLEKYVNDVQGIIDFETSGKVAGFISEAIQGVGGVLELVPGYLPAVYKIIREAGGLCIADEAITGFGRTGSHFWGFENHGVVPDIVTMAKGIGNGNPLGAVVTTPEIAQVLNDHSYYSTFGGNQVSTAAGLAVLDVIEKESLQRNAEVTGTYLKNRLIELKQRHKLIGDVRGRGFMLGVEFVNDRGLKTPAAKEAAYIMEEMKEMGVLVGIGGFHKNVFRITPPLCFTPDDADYLVKVMDHIMSKMCMCG